MRPRPPPLRTRTPQVPFPRNRKRNSAKEAGTGDTPGPDTRRWGGGLPQQRDTEGAHAPREGERKLKTDPIKSRKVR